MKQSERPRVIRSQASYPPPPGTLRELGAAADTIAVGKVAHILRQEHSPIGSASQVLHTVYAFEVEWYLKADGAPGRPEVLKVFNHGGIVDGLTYIQDD